MKILTASEMQRIDRLTSERYGVPTLTLMENAGRAVIDFLVERYSPLDRHKITVVCGRGNNGGDGFAAARLLRDKGLNPRGLLVGVPKSVKGAAAVHLASLAGAGAPETGEGEAAWQRGITSLART